MMALRASKLVEFYKGKYRFILKKLVVLSQVAFYLLCALAMSDFRDVHMTPNVKVLIFVHD